MYENDLIYYCPIPLNYFGEETSSKFNEVLKQLINYPGNVLVMCDDGKTRSGFLALILEAYCGSPLEEVQSDYMLSYVNKANTTTGSNVYNKIQYNTVDRLIYASAHIDTFKQNFAKIDWSKIDVSNINLRDSFTNYLQNYVELEQESLDKLNKKYTK